MKAFALIEPAQVLSNAAGQAEQEKAQSSPTTLRTPSTGSVPFSREPSKFSQVTLEGPSNVSQATSGSPSTLEKRARLDSHLDPVGSEPSKVMQLVINDTLISD